MIKKDLIIKVSSHYGNTFYYPLCKTSQVFADIAKTKTLSLHVLKSLREIGFIVNVEKSTIDFKTK
tara:strand:+ start:320 stop:517 length:198 start_codon:yes stop_codon:yes gene_type:complete